MNRDIYSPNFRLLYITAIPILAIVVASLYMMMRIFLFFITDYLWYEKLLGVFLLFAEGFILIHGIGYFLEIYSVIRHKQDLARSEHLVTSLDSYPPVAIIMSSYHEPLDVVERTITTFYNLTYPNKHIYFLDDTRYDIPWGSKEEMERYKQAIEEICKRIGVDLFRRKWHGAKAGMINDFLEFVDGKEKEGFTFYNFSGKKREEKERYIVVFDADQNPFPNFVEPLVAVMEANPHLAFTQTPQVYTNFEFNRISRAAGFQQSIFYEYICEGKSTKGAAFCCGTNVIFRRQALMDVGGFDETSVTEDFATSLKLHQKKWATRYLNMAGTFGMGPEDLGGYFKQQFRWALGTIGLFPKIIRHFIQNPFSLKLAQWWEYLLSSTWYFIGFVFFIMMVCPIIYLFLNVPSYFAKPELYLIMFFPYIVITFMTFYWTLKKRNYHMRDLIEGQILTFISFPVYIKAATLALLGIKGTFGITPKGGSRALPLKALWAQMVTGTLCFAAVVWGINRLIYEQQPVGGILANTFWCVYHCFILSMVLYFNYAQEDKNT